MWVPPEDAEAGTAATVHGKRCKVQHHSGSVTGHTGHTAGGWRKNLLRTGGLGLWEERPKPAGGKHCSCKWLFPWTAVTHAACCPGPGAAGTGDSLCEV